MHTLAHSVPPALQQPPPTHTLPETAGHSQATLGLSLMGSLLLSPAPGADKVLFVFYYAKAFDCVDHNKLRKILEEMGIPDHLTCLLRNLYASQEAAVRTRH